MGRSGRRGPAAVVLGMLLAFAAVADERPAQTATAVPPEVAAEIVRRLPDLLRVAALDPALAARLVPDAWLDLLVASALSSRDEAKSVPDRADPPHAGPVGPWPSKGALHDTLARTDPASVAALYGALRPRIALRCRARGVPPSALDAALRTLAQRVTDPSVMERARGSSTVALTRSQRELARLGVPIVELAARRTESVARRLWGADWRKAPAPQVQQPLG